jgi:hypothetical protein
MNAQSSRSLEPMARDGVTQVSQVSGAGVQGTRSLKVRWKVSYRVRGEFVEESGEMGTVNVG